MSGRQQLLDPVIVASDHEANDGHEELGVGLPIDHEQNKFLESLCFNAVLLILLALLGEYCCCI